MLSKKNSKKTRRTKKNNKKTAFFSGGCFWGIQRDFTKLKGVMNSQVGYMGGNTLNPKYNNVLKGNTNHAETVKLIYNSNSITYKELLDYFFKIHDSKTLNRQGPDIGTQYRSIVFYNNENELREYYDFLNSLSYKSKVTTQVLDAKKFKFNKAEEYHQNYYQKKTICKKGFPKTENLKLFKQICINNSEKAELNYTGKYNIEFLKQHKNGLFICSCCGNKLYNIRNMYDSKTGWPAFTRPSSILDSVIFNPKNKEVTCKSCNLHLGHRFFDGPTKTKIHDCINSVCLYFVDNLN